MEGKPQSVPERLMANFNRYYRVLMFSLLGGVALNVYDLPAKAEQIKAHAIAAETHARQAQAAASEAGSYARRCTN